MVDAVTSFGATNVDIDGWGLDIVVTGSQKALMLPPGLAVIFFNDRAWKKYDQCKNGRFYLDLARYKKAQEKDMTPFTPNVNLVMCLVKSLQMIKSEGKEAVFERHKRLRDTLRESLVEMGLKLVVDDSHASPSITSIWPPEGVEVAEIRKRLKEDYRIIVADGQEHLKGKIFRIGHMGYVFDRDIGMTVHALNKIISQLKPVSQAK